MVKGRGERNRRGFDTEGGSVYKTPRRVVFLRGACGRWKLLSEFLAVKNPFNALKSVERSMTCGTQPC